MSKDELVCVGAISGAYGVKGEVRIKSFCATPEDIEAYSPLTDETGKRSFSLAIVHSVKNGFVVRIAEVATKEEADALKGSPCMHTATSCRRCLMMNSTTPTWSA